MEGIVRDSNAARGTATIYNSKAKKTFNMTKVHLKDPDGAFPGKGDLVEYEAKKSKLKNGSVKINKSAAVQAPATIAATEIGVQQPRMPYQFVPIIFRNQDAEKRLNAHVVRDGSYSDPQEQLLTGKIDCELTVLTPLLVGQFRYGHGEMQENCEAPLSEATPSEKGILEPLFYCPRGDNTLESSRVLLSGAGLKGMLRHSLGAILTAPMERVQEQKYSYRPNMAPVGGRYQFREAIVVGTPDLENGILQVKILPRGRNAKFLKNGMALPADSTQFSYVGGIDGDAKLAWGQVYSRVAVANAILTSGRIINVLQVIVEQYLKTQEELADNEVGHLSTRHPDIDNQGHYQSSRKRHSEHVPAIKASIRRNTALKVDQLIFVEIDTENNDQIVSFGHHFRYRWRYADSVKTVQKDATGENKLRQEVTKLPGEHLGDTGGRLSGVRSLLGYVDDDLGIAEDNNDNFKRLAGRISINTAVEQIDDNASLDDRFVVRNGADTEATETRYNIPLKILGQPKASADQWYLDQRSKTHKDQFNSYGYLPGHEESGVALAGRKFYNHQSVTQENYVDLDKSNSNQSTLARFVSKPGIRFRFTVRFRDLRDWELGAILLTLSPELVLDDEKLKGILPKVANGDSTGSTKFAQKLGYAKSLGLGSVKIDICELHKLDSSQCCFVSDNAAVYVQMFGEYVENRPLKGALKEWFSIMNYTGGQRQQSTYPLVSDYAKKKFEQLDARRKP